MLPKGFTINTIPQVCKQPDYLPRYQLRVIQEYLLNDDRKVCALHGLRRTGKTVLIEQAVKWLNTEKIADASNLLYVTADRAQEPSLSEFITYIEKNSYKYIFIDEAADCKDFLVAAARLCDSLTHYHNKKVIIAGTNAVSMALVEGRALFDRATRVTVHHLTFYEHCKFVGAAGDLYEEFLQYLQTGGLFVRIPHRAYVREALIEHLDHTLQDPLFCKEYPKLAALAEGDYEALITNILMYAAGSNIDQKDVMQPYSFRRDSTIFGVSSALSSALQEYFARPYNIRSGLKGAELRKILEILEQCGLLLELRNIARGVDKGDRAKCYAAFPFMRFMYASDILENAGLGPLKLENETLGSFMELCVVTEYHIAHPDRYIYFWREPVGGIYLECDLVVSDFGQPNSHRKGEAYEIKASETSNLGRKRFARIAELHEDYKIPKENCRVLGGREVMDFVYDLGRSLYTKGSGAQRTSAFGDLNGWNLGG